ncbi:MAG: glycerophosphodiester phosphodiesterase [Actinobacteria bacterium]|nr:glycerophosphodiester phosphodiesterase [Actinomycetota bacterium]
MTSPFDIPVPDAVERVPVVLAHRGASRAAPENTLAAFRLATALGADGVELDARRCADGVVVVHHDASLGGDAAIVDLTFEQLRAVRPDVPTLDEALDTCPGIVNVEVKNFPNEPDYDPTEEVAAAVATAVARRNMHDRVIISSFTLDPLDRVRVLDERVSTAWLTLAGFAVADAVALARSRGYDALHPERGAVLAEAKRAVEAAHDAGLRINVWTVDDPGEVGLLASAGVDGLITNVPDVVRRALPAPRA